MQNSLIFRGTYSACIDLKRAQELNPDEAENFESFFADDAGYTEFYGYYFPAVN